MLLRAVGALIACVLFVCAPARAWTSAQVKDAHARIVLSSTGEAGVVLELGIEVRGGWLERFDLEGLSPSLVLDPDRPGWLTTAEGSVVAARVSTHEGAVAMRFDKREAAHRGLHRLSIAYRAALSEGSDGQRLAFVLPGFEQALDVGEVTIDAPRGVRAVRDPDSATEVSERAAGERVVIAFRRTHWPRSTPWIVEVASEETTATPATKSAATSTRGGAFVTGALLAATLLVLGWLARWSFRRSARRLGLDTTPWLPVRGTRAPWIVGCALAMALTWPFVLALSLGLGLALTVLCAERARPAAGAPRFSAVAPLGPVGIRSARRARWREHLGTAPWADVTTVSGLLGIGVLMGGAVLLHRQALNEPWPLALCCALPGWIASSRLRLPRSAAERLHRLLTTASRLRIEGCALRLIAHADLEGRLLEARLRIVPATRYAGLLRVDVCEDSRRGVSKSALCVVVRVGSPADRWLSKHFAWHERSLSVGGVRAAFVSSVGDPAAGLDALFGCLSRESQASLPKLRDVAVRAA